MWYQAFRTEEEVVGQELAWPTPRRVFSHPLICWQYTSCREFPCLRSVELPLDPIYNTGDPSEIIWADCLRVGPIVVRSSLHGFSNNKLGCLTEEQAGEFSGFQSVWAFDESSVALDDRAYAAVYDRSTIYASGSAIVDAYDSCHVVAGGEARVYVHGASSIVASENAEIILLTRIEPAQVFCTSTAPVTQIFPSTTHRLRLVETIAYEYQRRIPRDRQTLWDNGPILGTQTLRTRDIRPAHQPSVPNYSREDRERAVAGLDALFGKTTP